MYACREAINQSRGAVRSPQNPLLARPLDHDLRIAARETDRRCLIPLIPDSVLDCPPNSSI